jgi:tetratricopeptide (TPR) repeat protein
MNCGVQHLAVVLLAASIALVSSCAGGPGSNGRGPASPSSSAIQKGSQPRVEARRLTPEARALAAKLFEEGRAHKAAGDYASAYERFAKAREADPAYGLAHLEEAICGQYVGVDEQTLRARFAVALQELQDNPRALYERAAFEESHGNLPAALEGYSRALDLRPALTEARLARARAQLKSGLADEALETFRQVLEAHKDHIAALLGAAEASERTGDHAGAERALRRVVERFPDVPSHRQRLIAFYERTGQGAKAAREAQRLDSIDPREKKKMRALKPSRRR